MSLFVQSKPFRTSLALLYLLPFALFSQGIHPDQLLLNQFTNRPNSDPGVWAANANTATADGNEQDGRATDTVDEWFISPQINLSPLANPKLSFFLQTTRTDSQQSEPLSLWIATTYNPSAIFNPANWTKLTHTQPLPNSNTRTYSDEIDLAAFADQPIYLALRYRSSGRTEPTSTEWRIDTFKVYSDSTNEPKTLSLALSRSTISESDGQNAATGTVQLSLPAESPLAVTLLANPPNVLALPDALHFATGESSMSFPIHVHRDGVINGQRTITLTVTTPDYTSANNSITLLDSDVPLALSIETTVQSIAESASPIINGGKLTLNQPAPDGGLFVTLQTVPANSLSVPASVLIPEGSTSAQFDLQPRWNIENTTNVSTSIIAAATGISPVTTNLIVTNTTPTLSILLDRSNISERSTQLPVTATLSLLTPPTQNLIVTINYSDPTAIQGPSNAVIGVGQTSTTFTIYPVLNAAVDTDVDLLITASSPLTSTTSSGFTILNEPWTFEFTCNPTSILETAGPAAVTLTLTTSFPLPTPTAFHLSHTGRLTTPAELILPSNQSALTTTIGVVDHSSNTGSQAQTLTIIGPGGKAFSRSITLLDVVRHLELVATRNRIQEQGSVTLSINRTMAEAKPLLVRLSVDPEDSLALPAFVVIPANSVAPVTFEAIALYRPEKDSFSAIITAMATDYAPVTTSLTISDHTPVLHLSFASDTLSENAGIRESFGKLMLTPSIPIDTEVRIAATDSDRISFPQKVIIPAGQSMAQFSIESIADGWHLGNRSIVFTAESTGLTTSQAVLEIVESDPLVQPQISITTDAPRHRIILGSSIRISAAITANSSPLQSFELLANEQLLASQLLSPIIVDWTPLVMGTYTLSARLLNQESFMVNSAYERPFIVVEPNPINDNSQFVRQLYLDLFNTEPTAEALRQATDRLNGGTPRSTIATELLSLPLAHSLSLLHKASLMLIGRPLDWEELHTTAMTSEPLGLFALHKAGGLYAVADALMRSTDFILLHGRVEDLSDRDFFRAVYRQKYHGAEPTAQQLAQGVSRISNPDITLGFAGDRTKFLEDFILDNKLNNTDLIFNTPSVSYEDQSYQGMLFSAFWRRSLSISLAERLHEIPVHTHLEFLLAHPNFRDRFNAPVLDAYALGNGWKWTLALGYLYDDFWPWLYSPTIGWLWAANENPESLYLWSPIHGWLFSHDLWALTVYRFDESHWLSLSD